MLWLGFSVRVRVGIRVKVTLRVRDTVSARFWGLGLGL